MSAADMEELETDRVMADEWTSVYIIQNHPLVSEWIQMNYLNIET